jgi:hypothetical protein
VVLRRASATSLFRPALTENIERTSAVLFELRSSTYSSALIPRRFGVCIVQTERLPHELPHDKPR